MSKPSTALLIAGMHRSGTSFLGESCGALGFTLPRDAGGPAEDNPRGHFEPQAIVALNDAILAERGSSWLRIGPVDLPPADDAMLSRMDAAVEQSFADAARIMVKDPRLSLTLPLWRAWLEARNVRAAVLIALRDPREVAHSLARRNGFGADAAMLSWINHTLGSVEGSEGLPRQLVLFPDWTGDPAPTLARIAELFQDDLPPDAQARVAETFLPDAVHGRGEAAASERPVEQLALDLFAVLAQAAGRGEVPGIAELSPYRDRFAALSGAARAVEDAYARQIIDAQAEIAALEAQAEAAHAEYKAAATALTAARNEAALRLQDAVMVELPPLRLDKARFVVDVRTMEVERWGASGADSVRFLIATNPGQLPGPALPVSTAVVTPEIRAKCSALMPSEVPPS